jgi:NAD(P)-dependent dehydrogenase (short-subunit alcohol dehydrogenase family)
VTRFQRAAELGDAAVGVIADLTVDGAADSLVHAALDRRGRVDVLANNAGNRGVRRPRLTVSACWPTGRTAEPRWP